MAGDDDRDRVGPAGAADRPRHRPQLPGDGAIGQRLTIWNIEHGLPDRAAEIGARWRQWQVELHQLSRQIGAKLGFGFVQQSRDRRMRASRDAVLSGGRQICRIAPVEGDQSIGAGGNPHRPHRCIGHQPGGGGLGRCGADPA